MQTSDRVSTKRIRAQAPVYNFAEGREPKGSVTRPVRADSRERPAFLNFKRGAAIPAIPEGVSFLAVNKMKEIFKTKDYSIFKKNRSNRDILPQNLNKIVESISKNNLLQFRPILVNSKMEVLDGQHRLEAAKILNVEIYYQISDKKNDQEIILLNANQKPWMPKDYLNFFVSQGNPEYIKMKEFSDNHKLSVECILSFLSNKRTADVRKEFKDGSFKFPNDEKMKRLAERVGTIIEIIKTHRIRDKDLLESRRFITSLFIFLNRSDVDFDIFCEKARFHSNRITSLASTKEFVDFFTYIYNYKKRKGFLQADAEFDEKDGL